MLRQLAKLSPEQVLLFVGMLIFTGIWIVVKNRTPGDTQFLEGIVTGFSAAFFAVMRPHTPAPPGTTQTTVSTVEVPPENASN